MHIMKKLIAGLGLGAALAFAAPEMAGAQTTKQDGLVNVNIGDVTVLEDVNIAVAANLVAQVCGVSVDAVVAVIAAVDQNSRQATFCRTSDGKVKVTQN
jgi:hypothetical protein